MPACTVLTCRNSSSSIGENGITFYSFPRNEQRALLWFLKCKRKDKKRPGVNDKICSAHFQPTDYERDVGHELLGKPSNPKLKDTAVPTLKLPYLYIKPADARKLLQNPTLARHLSKSSSRGSGNSIKKFGSVSGLLSSITVAKFENSTEECDTATDISETVLNVTAEISKGIKEAGLLGGKEERRISADNHCQTLLSQIRHDESLTDVTLICQNKRIRAHKAILSQTSDHFRQVISLDASASSNLEVIISDVEFEDLVKLIEFIYHGDVSVKACEFDRFIEAVKTLRINPLIQVLDTLGAAHKMENDAEGTKHSEAVLRESPRGHTATSPKRKPRSVFSLLRGRRGAHNVEATRQRAWRADEKAIPRPWLSQLKNGLVAALYFLY